MIVVLNPGAFGDTGERASALLVERRSDDLPPGGRTCTLD